MAGVGDLMDKMPEVGAVSVGGVDDGRQVGDEAGVVNDDEGGVAAHGQGGVGEGEVFEAAAELSEVSRVWQGQVEGDEVAGFGDADVLNGGREDKAFFFIDAEVAGEVEGMEGLGFLGVGHGDFFLDRRHGGA